MGKYILKRLLLMIPVIFGVCILVFTIMYFTPGDPAAIILGPSATDAEIQAMRESMGLNDSYLVRLGSYLKQVFIHFDLGNSYSTGVPVVQELKARFPNTLILDAASMVISLGAGIYLGVNAAVHQNSVRDYGSMVIALLGVCMPGFWFALMLVLLFALKLEWLPAYGMGGLKYWILPILSNAFRGVASLARLTRSSMLEVINSDYVVMARSKGMPAKKVIYKHALPNALIPVITMAGMTFGSLLGGGLLIETIFSIPGVGYYLVSGVNNRDYNVVQGSIIFLAIAFSIVMLITDLIMAYVDPRIKSQFVSGKRRKKNA